MARAGSPGMNSSPAPNDAWADQEPMTERSTPTSPILSGRRKAGASGSVPCPVVSAAAGMHDAAARSSAINSRPAGTDRWGWGIGPHPTGDSQAPFLRLAGHAPARY